MNIDKTQQTPQKHDTILSPLDAKPISEEIENLVTLFNQGRYIEGEIAAKQLLNRLPQHGFIWKCLGLMIKLQGRAMESLEPMQKAVSLMPMDAEAHSNLGVIFNGLGRLEEAEASYRCALEIEPDYAQAFSNLGLTLNDQGRMKEAEDSFRRALEIKPDYAEALSNLGLTLNDQGRLQEAEANYRCALEIKPDFAEAYLNLGVTLNDQGRLKEAEASYRHALEIKPDYAEAHSNLGLTLNDQGRLHEAEASYRYALGIKPDYENALSSMLFTMTKNPSHHPSDYFEEACRFGQLAAKKVGKKFTNWHCAPNPERLRIGLVSGDLRNHPVGFFLESILAQISPSRIEFIAYSTNYKVDELTARIKTYFSEWKTLAGLNDKDAASLIHSDGVNVLVDLSGHTAYNRLAVFAWKPARVQATWLGYLASTGLAEIDYILGDPYATPLENDWHFTENVWRMPEVWACFTPPTVATEVGSLPALSTSSLTFGSFNNLSKMNNDVSALWARILQAIPNSRLFLKTKQLGDATVCEMTRQLFVALGIEPDRLILEGVSPRKELLEAYKRVDIALDPFPYGGGATTYELLWMGVPFICRKGNSFLSRCGQSLAFNAGLSDWIAKDDDDYVAKAVIHSQNLIHLSDLRAGLRRQVLASQLFDAPSFARHFANALWGMWENTRYF